MSHHSTYRWARRSLMSVAIAAAAMLALSACTTPAQTAAGTGGDSGDAAADEVMLQDHGLAGMDARAVIEYLDALPMAERPDDLMASIRPNELVLLDTQKREVSLPMPDDAFYVSIAPYEIRTHDCYFHSLTTCTAEIQNEQVQVLVTDADSGEVLIDETRTTFDNGFMGMWLPRNIDATVTIEYDDRAATTDLSTRHDDDATCVTTMKLT